MNRRTQQEMEEIEEEEEDYVNAPRGAVDAKRTRPGRRVVLLIAVCWIVLLAIVGLRLYVDTLSHESEQNQVTGNSTLRTNNTKLSLENANLTRDNKNLKDQLDNLTQAYNVSESNNKELKKNRKELNISRAQWSIDEYCLGNTDDKCKACQDGWNLTQSSCYVYVDAKLPNRTTWEEAQEDCRGRNSDLAVARDSEEKEAIDVYSFGSRGFWIGLRVEDGKWKWVDGSDLTERSWIDPPDPADGRCAMCYRKKWYSVSCGEKRRWICQKKALSV